MGLVIALAGLTIVGVAIWRTVGESWIRVANESPGAIRHSSRLRRSFLAGIGILVAFGHAEILLDRDFVVARERSGLVRWTWKQPLGMTETLEVKTALVNPRQERTRDLYRIQAGDIFLAPGFRANSVWRWRTI